MRIIIFLALFCFTGICNADEWDTYYEKSGFINTPQYDETINYCKKLAHASPYIHYTTFGNSPQLRDLPLLIIDINGNFSPTTVNKTNNAILFIQAGIHAGEIDGKDAGLMLIRDITIKNVFSHLLSNVTILFCPIFNVDGHERFGPYNRANQNGPEEMGWRTTAQNLNLNRDYLKADSPEMQAMLTLYSKWQPDFYVDCHVTDGADYQYVITYKIDQEGILEKNISDWIANSYLPALKPKMAQSGFPTIQYISTLESQNLLSGLETWASPPRLSDGYSAIQNRPGLLIETHMFKNYKQRVSATYEMLKHTIDFLNNNNSDLKQLLKTADLKTSSADFRSNPLPVSFKLSPDSIIIPVKSYKMNKVKSDLTAGDWYRYSADTVTYFLPFFNKMTPETHVTLPAAYIIPPEWINVINRLKLHGIKYQMFNQPTKIEVQSFSFSNVQWKEKPYEGRHRVTFDLLEISEKRTFPRGSVLVPIQQRTAKVIAHIFEPKAPDSFVSWGFFDAIFEQKEYVEKYVMEERARMMLASDEQLRREFEDKIKSDSNYVDDQKIILDWFYKKSPYWDQKMNKYPVGKIFNTDIIDSLALSPWE